MVLRCKMKFKHILNVDVDVGCVLYEESTTGILANFLSYVLQLIWVGGFYTFT